MHRTYNPKEVVMYVGDGQVEGWDSIVIRRNVPQARQVQGIWGKPVKISNYQNTSCTLEITLAYGSETNTLFTQFVELDLRYQGGIKLNVTLRDLQGDGLVFTSNTAYMEGMPEESFSSSSGTKVWRIFCDTSDWRISTDKTSDEPLTEIVLSALL